MPLPQPIPSRIRQSSLALAAMLSLGAGSTAIAATHIFSGTTSGTYNWAAGASWDSSPVSASDTSLNYTGTLAASVAIISNNDVASPPFSLNALNFTNVGPGTGTAPTLTLQGSQLEFVTDGATTPTISFNTTGTVRPTVAVNNALLLTNNLTVNATSDGRLGGALTDIGTLTKTGAGNLTLSGASTTYDGTEININAGILSFVTGLSLSTTPTLNLGDTTGISAAATLVWANNALTTNNALVVRSGNAGTKSVQVNTGVSASVASLTLDDNLTKSANTGTLTVSGATTLAGTSVIRTLTVNGGTLTLTGAVGQSGGTNGLTKAGAGALNLNGNNNFSGNLNIGSTGTVTLGHSNAAGLGTIALASTNTGVGSNPLALTGGVTVANNITMDATTGRNNLTNASGSNALTGNITINGTGNIHQIQNQATGTTTFTIGAAMPNTTTITGATFANNLSFRGTGTSGVINSRITAANASVDFNATATNWTINSSGNSWAVTGILGAGNLTLGATDALATGARLDHSGAGDLILNGFNQTIAGLNRSAAVSGAQIINNSASTDSQLTIAGMALDLVYANAIANGGAAKLSLVMNSAGRTQTLSGTNTYTGDTTISAGTLRVGSATALGGTAAGTSVATGAALEIQGTITTSAEALSLSGTGISDGGALRNISGDNTCAGAITLATASRINSDAGTLNLNVASGSAITSTDLGVTFGGAGDITVSDAISLGTAGVTKDGSGILTYNAANTYTGTTTVNGGRLVMAANQTNNGDVVINDTGTVKMSTTRTFKSGTNVAVNTGGTWLLDGSSQTVGQLTGAGTIDMAYVTTGGTDTLTVGSGDVSSTFDGVIQEEAVVTTRVIALTKIGTGTLTLTGANTHGGTTSVSGGILRISNASALGDTTAGTNITGGTATSRLELTGEISFAAETVNLDGRSTNAVHLSNLSGNNTWNGNISTTVGGNTYTIESQADKLTIAGGISVNQSGGRFLNLSGAGDGEVTGVISGSGSNTAALTKLGGGTWTLSNTNTYTGATTVTLGTLSLGNGTANTGLDDGADVVIDAGATLNLNYPVGNTDTIDELWINGVQKSPGVYGASDPSGQITGTGTLTVQNGPPASPYDQWATVTHGLSGGNAAFDFDYDNDGLANGLEWILGGDPTTSSTNKAPAPSLNESGDLILTFTREESSIPVATLKVLIGTDLATWPKEATIGATSSGPDANGIIVSIDTAATPDAVTITIPDANAAAGKIFARLEATKP